MANKRAFLEKLEAIVREHYTDEQFGVSELVELCGISRSQLHRKLKSANGKSISKYIREFRLEEAYKLLRDEDFTASEVAFKVGFNSASYFNTCFNDYFGYPPGEVRHMEIEERPTGHDMGETTAPPLKNRRLLLYILVVFIIIAGFFTMKWLQDGSVANSGKNKPKTIAVLPFKNWSGDPELEYVSDGMTDAVIRRLSTLSDLDKVVPFSTIIIYKDSDKTTAEIAKELNVEYVLEGNFKLAGTEVMSNLDLIEADSNDFIWSLEYTGVWDTDDIFQMQAAVAENVAENMQVNVSSNEKDEISAVLTESEEAYRLFLLAESNYWKLDAYGLENSIIQYEKAIAIDSTFVEPYIGLGRTYYVSGLIWGLMPQQEAWALAKKYLRLAQKLNDPEIRYYSNLIDDQLIGGAFYYEYDLESAERHFKELYEGNDDFKYREFGFDYARKTGRLDQTMELIEKELEQFPVISDGLMQKAFITFMMGDKESAVKQLNDLDPYYQDNNFYLAETSKWYYYMEEYEKSLNHVSRLLYYFEDRSPMIFWLIAVNGEIIGDKERVDLGMSKLKERLDEGASGSPAWFIALYYCHLKDYDTAFEWLNTAYERKEVELTWFKEEPMLQPLKDDPRYIELYNKIGFDVIEPLETIQD